LLIESPDGFFGNAAFGVINERKAAWTAGFPIDGKNDLGGFTDARQVLSQLCLRRRVRQVPDKQTN
jgi:hypothetical protein